MTMGAEIWGLIMAGVAVVVGLVFRAGANSATSRAQARAAEQEQRSTADAREAAADAGRAGARTRLDEGTF